jgi:hypothetical protein
LPGPADVPPPPPRGQALAVVLESGDVVGGGLDAQDEGEFVIDLDRRSAETMLDAGSLDPRCELTSDLLGELGSDLVAEEGGDVFGFDSEDGLPGKLFIEGFQGWLASGTPDQWRTRPA